MIAIRNLTSLLPNQKTMVSAGFGAFATTVAQPILRNPVYRRPALSDPPKRPAGQGFHQLAASPLRGCRGLDGEPDQIVGVGESPPLDRRAQADFQVRKGHYGGLARNAHWLFASCALPSLFIVQLSPMGERER
jgi:hypothetical protein